MARFARSVVFLTLVISMLFGPGTAAGIPGAQAQAGVGTIAYTPASTRNEVRLINSDGTNNRPLWKSGVPDQPGADDIWSMAWRANGSALTFASTHEAECSLNHADVYTINADGTGYRRITEGPACAALASLPKGTVRVPVKNVSLYESFTGFAYFQGAPGLQIINLPPNGSTTLTFNNVADFGAGELQVGVSVQGAWREVSTATAVDVVTGGTVTTGTLNVSPLDEYYVWEAFSPTWHYSGSQIGYLFNYNSIRKISPTPAPLDFGANMLAAPGSAMPDFVSRLAYGPTQATANQLLYVGSTTFEDRSIYLVTEGSSSPGTPLVTLDFSEWIMGLAWLPDGSGFAYSLLETSYSPTYTQSANIFIYTFANKASTRVTHYTDQFAGQLSVSPDGQQIVFERGSSIDIGYELENSDLYIVNRNGSGVRLLVANGRAPAWRPGASAPPVTLNRRVYLPFMRK